ncbi:CocE/NonD family hydrolase [Streptomyces sp. NPDC047070]|uniref:CocE/NonD family hydrolase n=1 Tax=Streptomyces sp. NPDC047070 TaxID=3154923 RepID=UPI0034530997
MDRVLGLHTAPYASEASRPAPVDARADSAMVRMPDGIRLATDVYLPEPVGAPRPAVLVRLPYDKSGRYTFLPDITARLTAYGFAAVVQDVRGKFRSDGERLPFVNEAADGAATIDWIVRRPWSNGVVGMMGDSYYGFTQWAAASTEHPALRAIVPRVTGSEFFRMFSPDLVPKLPLYEWIVHTFSVPGMLERPFADSSDGVRYVFPEEAPQVAGVLRDLVTGNADGSLRTRVFPSGPPALRLRLPALHMGGWWDNLQRSQLADWRAVSTAPAATHQFLRMGATDHEDFHLHEDDEPHHDHEVDDAALRRYLDVMTADPLDFFDHYLRDRGGVWHAPRVRYEVANSGWRVADRWVPGDTTDVSLRLGGLERAVGSRDGGSLAQETTSGSTAVSWIHDPADPVPYLVESEWGQCAALPDEGAVHEREDVATFTSQAQEASVEIVGHVDAELEVEAPTSTTHVVARLLDVYPSGRARLIVEGAAVVHTRSGPARVRVDMGDTAYLLRAGHALRLAISTSCFPLYALHPGTEDDLWRSQTTAALRQTLHSGPEQPSLLCLSVRGGQLG